MFLIVNIHHRFRWRHLTEKLTHEQAVKKQKIRIEREQAKKETAAFIANVEATKRLASIKERKLKKGEVWKEKRPAKQYRQRKTVEEMRADKTRRLAKTRIAQSHVEQQVKPNADHSRKNVLSQIFSS